MSDPAGASECGIAQYFVMTVFGCAAGSGDHALQLGQANDGIQAVTVESDAHQGIVGAAGAEILGNGPDAVPALVEKFKQIGVL